MFVFYYRLIDITMTAINCALVLLAMVIVTSVTSDAMANTCQPTSREHQMRQGITHQFHPGPIQDHVLRGSVYRNKTTSSYVMCAVLCLQDDTCKSFNYCNDKRCELNSAMYKENKTALEPSRGCLYFDEEFHEEFHGEFHEEFHEGKEITVHKQLISLSLIKHT